MTREHYDKMLEAYRQIPESHRNAGLAAGVAFKTARKFWREGSPRQGWPPIKDIIKAEQIAARAASDAHAKALAIEASERMQDVAEQELAQHAAVARAEQDAARQQAIATRVSEGKMVAAARGNTIGLLSLLGRCLKGAMKSADWLEQALETGMVPGTSTPLTYQQRMNTLRIFGSLAERSDRAVHTILQAERLLMGEPTEVIGVSAQSMSMDEALHVLRTSNKALARAERKGQTQLRLVHGGAEGSMDESGAEEAADVPPRSERA